MKSESENSSGHIRTFGLVSVVDRPKAGEHFPMASGVLVEAEDFFILLTAGHYLQDVRRWKEEDRLLQLSLLINHESGICSGILLNLDEVLAGFCHDVDVGYLVLGEEIMRDVIKYGGHAIGRDRLVVPGTLKMFFLIGLAAAHTQMKREIIATGKHNGIDVAWTLNSPNGFATVFSPLRYIGLGSDLGTLRFEPVQGIPDYGGASGGPIIGYTEGSLIRDYCLVGIQSKQILAASREAVAKELITTSAEVSLRIIENHLREMANSPD